MESKKINQLATNVAPQTSDLTIIGDPITGVSKKITLLQIANLFATTGTVTSVAVTETGNALTITGSPITSAGTINIGFAGAASQYVRGDGALADFPTSTGGGSSVSYYLNSSVSQGTIGGNAYRQLSKTPVIGAGTDITISANGYVANYITDVNDPALLEVPGGNFNCEFYFSVNSNNHDPFVYAELYKYDGTTFTLLGSNQAIPDYLSNGTTLSAYYFAIPVATAALTITDRLAIRIYVNVDGRVVTLHTENGHLCQVVTTFSKGLTSLNNLTRQVQFLATGTSGTDFNISSSTATHTFNLPVASATNTGKLSSTDWSTFNAKQPAGNYVTLDTTQTISGVKTFTTSNLFTGANLFTNFSQRFNQGVAILETANFGATVDYTTIVGAVNGLALRLSSDGKKIFAFADATTNNTFTFPNATGTIALTSNLSSYVPYTGATTNVDLGTNTFASQNIYVNGNNTTNFGFLGFKQIGGSGSTGQSGYTSIYAVGQTDLYFNYNTGSTTYRKARFSSILIGDNTEKLYYLPASDGTLALTSQLHDAVTIGTANGLSLSGQVLSLALASTSTTGALSSTDWNTFNGKQAALNGTGFVKISGTTISYDNSTYLTTSAAASTYLPLTGGTLSGALNINLNSGTGLNVSTENVVFRASPTYGFPRQLVFSMGSGPTTTLEAKGFGGNYITDFNIKTYNASGTAFDVFFGTANGDVGIGNNSPAAKLDVNGSIKGTGLSLVTGGSTSALIQSSGTNVYTSLSLLNTTTGYGYDIGFGGSASIAPNSFYIYGGSSASVKFLIDSGGNVGIGTSSPSALLHAYSSTNNAEVSRFEGAYSSSNSVVLARFSRLGNAVSNVIRYADSKGLIEYGSTTAHDIGFITSDTERMRITSGGTLLIGQSTSTLSSNGWQISGGGGGHTAFSINNNEAFIYNNINTGVYYDIDFRTNSVSRGKIRVNDSSTSYLTSSDYRLKEDLKEINGLEKVSAIKVYDFRWKTSKERTDGVLAHELAEVLPYAVSGEKDGKEMQGVDYSKIVPLLVKSIQELEARIKQLENK
jgi:hypothetical protein